MSNFKGKKTADAHRINSNIRELEVRLVDLPGNYEDGVYKLSEALRISEELNLDLIEISNKSKPVICKIMDYSKFKYDKKKKEKEIKKKAPSLRDLKFSPDITDNDLAIKSKKTLEFLSDGDKVRITVQFKGRGIVFKDRGTLVLLKLASMVEGVGIPESLPELNGKKMSFIIKPKK